jgi:methionyl-tRNA formyltransferase
MRLVFAGTPQVAVPSLDALVNSGHEVVAVISRTDAPRGRKRVMTPSPVTARAREHGRHVIAANRLDDDVTQQVAALKPDLGVIVAYGGLVREPLLHTPPLGWINVHFSLLPRWRGAAPVQRAIMAGDAVTGAAVFQLVAELDAGAVYATRERAIGADETAGELLDALAIDGAGLVTTVVEELASGTARATEQHGEPTIAAKLTLEDARVRWAEPAHTVYDRIRAVTPEPGAFTMLEGERFKLLTVRKAADDDALPPGEITRVGKRVLVGTATHPLELHTVQPAGKRSMAASDWWRGRSVDSPVVAQ